MVWKLFHINAEIESCSNNIEEADAKLQGLKTAQVNAIGTNDQKHLADVLAFQTDEEKKMKKAKDAQAKANLAVKKQEAVVKAAERSLDEKVNRARTANSYMELTLTNGYVETRPTHP
jgi:predicted nucleotidyltransferase